MRQALENTEELASISVRSNSASHGTLFVSIARLEQYLHGQPVSEHKLICECFTRLQVALLPAELLWPAQVSIAASIHNVWHTLDVFKPA